MTVITIGESMGLFRGAGIGTFASLGSAEIDTGGAEANVAIGLARLGVGVTWVGRVGDDSIGRRVLRDLRGEGVTVAATVDPSANTGIMIKESPRSGTTSVRYYRAGSAGSRLSPCDLDLIDVEHADLLHITGITPALSESAHETVRSALRRAKAAGVNVSFDVNHRSRLWSEARAAPIYRELAAQADILFAGIDEAQILLGRSGLGARTLADAIAELGPNEVVIKEGADGASVLSDGIFSTHAALPVEVVDTVGAGDAFVAGYLAERLADESATNRLRTATMCGAFACTHPSDWHGFATREELSSVGGDPVTR